MTIVPREWERRGVSPAAPAKWASFTWLRATFLVLGLACLVLGVVIVGRGELLGLAAVCFGVGYVARAFPPRA